MTTQPLPPPEQDPAITEAIQIKDTFTQTVQALRMNTTLTDLQVAQQVVTAWTAANDRIADLYNDLQARRQARITMLEQTVPVGPGIPADASPADAAVMQQAFRAALAQAREAMPQRANTGSSIIPVKRNTLDGMLADAEAFDDDTLRRAVLTAAVENGTVHLIRSWAAQRGLSDQLDELAQLQEAITGRGLAGMWVIKAFTPIPKPEEVWKLPDLEAAAQAQIEGRIRGAVPLRRSVF